MRSNTLSSWVMPKNCSRSHENNYDHENFLSEPSQDDPDPTLRAISCTLAPDELPSNERTPLLSYSDVTGDYTGKRVRSSGTRRTPLPLFQVSILLFLQLSEPVTSQSIYPFINEVCIFLLVKLLTRLIDLVE